MGRPITLQSQVDTHLRLFSKAQIFLILLSFIIIPSIASSAFNDYFTTSKWIALYICCAMISITFLFYRPLTLPQLSKAEVSLFIIILCLTLLNSYLAHGIFISVTTLDRLTLCLAIIIFYWFSQKQSFANSLKFLSIAAVPVVIYSYSQLFGFNIYPLNKLGNTIDLGGMFGNVNLCSQFLGLGFLASLFLAHSVKSKTKYCYILLAIVVLSYIFQYYNRSVLLAISLGVGIGVLTSVGARGLQMTVKPALTLAIIILAFSLKFALNPLIVERYNIKDNFSDGKPPASETPELSKSPEAADLNTQLQSPSYDIRKRASLHMRLQLWQDTLKLIVDHPFGIGTKKFSFAIIPHQTSEALPPIEEMLWENPHNEYLRIIAEDGIIYFLLLLAMAFLLLRKYFLSNDDRNIKIMVMILIIYFFIEQMFQFPMESAPSLFIFAAIVGYVLKASNTTTAPLSIRSRSVLSVLIVVIFAETYSIANAYYNISHFPGDENKMSAGCQDHPEIWESCYYHGLAKYYQQDYPKAKELLAQILASNPYHLSALKIWSVSAIKLSQYPEGCRGLWVYDSLLHHKSAIHNTMQTLCASQFFSFKAKSDPISFYNGRID